MERCNIHFANVLQHKYTYVRLPEVPKKEKSSTLTDGYYSWEARCKPSSYSPRQHTHTWRKSKWHHAGRQCQVRWDSEMQNALTDKAHAFFMANKAAWLPRYDNEHSRSVCAQPGVHSPPHLQSKSPSLQDTTAVEESSQCVAGTHTHKCARTHTYICVWKCFLIIHAGVLLYAWNLGNNISERYRVEIYYYLVWSNMRDLCTLVWVTLNNLALDHWPQADNTASVSLKQSRPASSSAFNKLWRWIVMILSTGCFPPSLDQPGPVRSRLARRGTAHSAKMIPGKIFQATAKVQAHLKFRDLLLLVAVCGICCLIDGLA